MNLYLKKLSLSAAGVLVAGVLFLGAGFDSLATEATVKVDSAKVRKTTSTSEEPITGVSKGTTVEILDETNDSKGSKWYKVRLSDTTEGYIRADLLEVSEGSSTTVTASAEAPAEDASAEAETPVESAAPAVSVPDGVTPVDAQYATVKPDAGKVRSDASTSVSVVDTLSKGAQMIIYGSKNDADGKEWFYVTFTGTDGSEKTGFMRTDLVNKGDLLPKQEEAPVEEAPVEETPAEPETPVVPADYEAVFTADGSGNDVWYLYDHINNNRLKIQELLDYANSQNQGASDDKAAVKKLRILAIVLAILLVAAVVAVAILGIKLREALYDSYADDDDDDDDEDDEEDEQARAVRRRRAAYEEEDEDDDDYDEEDDEDEEDEEDPRQRMPQRRTQQAAPVRRPVTQQTRTQTGAARPTQGRTAAPAGRRAAAPRQEVQYDPDDVLETAKKPAVKKSKNFLLDDDDFEFEFLNMDDNN